MLACALLNRKYLFVGRVGCQEQSQLPQLRAVVHRLEVAPKNVTSNTKRHFTTNSEYQQFLQSWNRLIYSSTEEDYNTGLSEFEKRYQASPSLRYVKETWLIRKEKFIVAWTQQYLHLGNSATSRVEGSHAFLKKHIGASTGDMLIVFERISQALQAQHTTLQHDFARDQIERPVVSLHPFYTNIATRTSRYSIRLISEQVTKAKRATKIAPLPPCTNTFTRTMGLPLLLYWGPIRLSH